MHQSVDQNRAIKTVKRTITELDRSKIEEQKKPSVPGMTLTSNIGFGDLRQRCQALLKRITGQNERMFLVTFLKLLNTGRTGRVGKQCFSERCRSSCPEAG